MGKDWEAIGKWIEINAKGNGKNLFDGGLSIPMCFNSLIKAQIYLHVDRSQQLPMY